MFGVTSKFSEVGPNSHRTFPFFQNQPALNSGSVGRDWSIGMCWNVFIYPSMYLSIKVSTYVYLSPHLSKYLCVYLSINLSMYVFIYIPYINIMLMPPNFIPLLLLDKAQNSDPRRLPAAIDPNVSKTAFVCN